MSKNYNCDSLKFSMFRIFRNRNLETAYVVHNFRFSSDCSQALIDIRNYGDFCDNEDLYDQSGRLEAQFTFSYECRNALGWYY